MCGDASDFSGVTVGDKLWSMQLGECTVIDVITFQRGYRIQTRIECRSALGDMPYNHDGVQQLAPDVTQSLFWSRPEIIAPPRPKRKVVKTVEAWANVYPGLITPSYPTRESADENAAIVDAWNRREDIANPRQRIACVHLTGTYETDE